MTKYVLNSGGVKRHLDLKRKFHQEIVEGLGSEPKILLCNFAQGREYWEAKFPSYSTAVAEDMPAGTKPTFELAIPDNFIQQCKNADVIYIHGGDDQLMQYWMKQFDVPAIFENKVVATNSASSDMLASAYWTCDWRECQDGFGILPIKFIPHFGSDFGNDDPRGPIDWEKAKAELAQYGDKDLPVHALGEGEYIVIEK